VRGCSSGDQPAAGYLHAVTTYLLKALSSSYIALGNRDMKTIPAAKLKEDMATVTTSKPSHSRPNQLGSAKFDWAHQKTQEALNNDPATTRKELFAGFKQEFDELPEVDRLFYTNKYKARVLGQRANEKAVKKHTAAENQRDKPSTPWSKGDGNYPMLAQDVETYLGQFTDRDETILRLQTLGLHASETNRLLESKRWSREDLAALEARTKFEHIFTTSESPTYNLAKTLYAESGVIENCLCTHYGFCQDKDNGKRASTVSLATALGRLVRRLPKSFNMQKQFMITAKRESGEDVYGFLWLGGGKLKPMDPVFTEQDIVPAPSQPSDSSSSPRPALPTGFYYGAVKLPLHLKDAVREVNNNMVEPGMPRNMFSHKRLYEVVSALSTIASASSWSFSLMAACCEDMAESGDMLRVTAEELRFSVPDLLKKTDKTSSKFDDELDLSYGILIEGRRRLRRKTAANAFKQDPIKAKTTGNKVGDSDDASIDALLDSGEGDDDHLPVPDIDGRFDPFGMGGHGFGPFGLEDSSGDERDSGEAEEPEEAVLEGAVPGPEPRVVAPGRQRLDYSIVTEVLAGRRCDLLNCRHWQCWYRLMLMLRLSHHLYLLYYTITILYYNYNTSPSLYYFVKHHLSVPYQPAVLHIVCSGRAAQP
jgi:hypothetical protein